MQRIQFDLTEDQVKEIETLMERTRTSTKREFFNNAIAILEWAVDESSSGRKIGSMDDKSRTYKELYMPIFKKVPVAQE